VEFQSRAREEAKIYKRSGDRGKRLSRRHRKLDAKGTAAAASALDVGIVELEAGALDGLDIVN
jgi:hypothetical protein